MLLQASYGVNLLRFFGNIDGLGKAAGYGYVDTSDKSILVSIDPVTLAGTYNETNFRRFDLVLAEACKTSVSQPVVRVLHIHAILRNHCVVPCNFLWDLLTTLSQAS